MWQNKGLVNINHHFWRYEFTNSPWTFTFPLIILWKFFFVVACVGYYSLVFNGITSFCSLPSVTLSNFSSSSSMNNRCLPLSASQITKKLNTTRRPTACITTRIQPYIHTSGQMIGRWGSTKYCGIWDWYSRAEWSTVTLLMADISRNTIMDKTTHNSQRYVSRGSQILLCPFVLTS